MTAFDRFTAEFGKLLIFFMVPLCAWLLLQQHVERLYAEPEPVRLYASAMPCQSGDWLAEVECAYRSGWRP